MKAAEKIVFLYFELFCTGGSILPSQVFVVITIRKC